MRELRGLERHCVDTIAAGFALFFMYSIAVTLPFYITRPIYICLCYILVFALFPISKRSCLDRISVLDYLLCTATIAVTVFFMHEYDYYVMKPGLLRPQDIVVGSVALVLSVDACRRVLGWPLPILTLLAIAYVLWGNFVPGELGHRGFGYARLMGQIFSFDGIYGSITGVYSTYVLLFIVFGTVIQATGMGTVLIELSDSLVGHLRGGTAKSSVVASGVIGSIMGSGAANVAVTGAFTIPLMKKAGFPAYVAGAVETVASAGGVLLPPVMGSVAFVLASFTQTSYRDVVLVSLLPGLLFYWGIYSQVHFMSHRLSIPTASPEKSVFSVLKSGGHMLLPIPLILWLIFIGMTPYRAGLWTIAFTLALHYLKPVSGHRLTPLDVIRSFGDGAKLQLSVGASAGVIGVIIAALVLPGLPLKIASFAVAMSHGNLFILLLLMILVSYVFGMGLPVVASYILLAVIAAPALIELGLPVLTAHLIIMWFSLAALWTPPVAVGAFVASGIANANPNAIGWTSMRLGIGLYIIPFLMAYGDIVGGELSATVFAAFCVGIGIYCLAIAIEGYTVKPLSVVERGIYACLALASFYPEVEYRAAAMVVLAGWLLWERRQAWRSRLKRLGSRS